MDLDRIGRVVLVLSSSRGGSSMLAELLRPLPGVLTLPGELNPYVVLAQLDATVSAADIVRAEIARDIGRPVDGDVDLQRLARDAEFRLAMQWPHVDIEPAAVDAAVRRAAATAAPTDPDAFSRAVLDALGQPRLPLAGYDVTGSAPALPPVEPVVEMTPYVGLRSWRAPTERELERDALVLTTPRNSYRIDWLRRLFPRAELRLVHLTRNPAAAVNGLLDGWGSPAFFTTKMPIEVNIDGYTGSTPESRRWWKYDVPPSWREFTSAPLARVCAEQWRSAHDAVLRYADDTATPTTRIAYEDLVGSVERRADAGRRLANAIGVEVEPVANALVTGTRPVMATVPPSRRRWSSSSHDLAPALAEPAVWDTAVRLEYEVEERLWI